MIELEKTYLAKKFPEDLKSCKFKEIIDLYFPKTSDHPKIRLRKSGNKFELTKKEPAESGDASNQIEQTIILTETEFKEFSKLGGKEVSKIRYYFDYNGQTAEFDIFQNLLKGLVTVDFEFVNLADKDNFLMPDFCLADITQEIFTAGGMICGKSYEDIENVLKKYNYKKLILK